MKTSSPGCPTVTARLICLAALVCGVTSAFAAADLWIRDDINDVGNEPNNQSAILYLSENWVASLHLWAPVSKDTLIYDSGDRFIRQWGEDMDQTGNWVNAINILAGLRDVFKFRESVRLLGGQEMPFRYDADTAPPVNLPDHQPPSAPPQP